MTKKETARESLEMNEELTVTEESSPSEEVEACEKSSSSLVKNRSLNARPLGERLFSLGILISLIGVIGFYTRIAQLAFNGNSVINEQQKPEIEESEQVSDLTEDLSDSIVEDLSDQANVVPQEEVQSFIATITYNGLNVRSAPDSTASKLGMLYLNEEVSVLENDEQLDFIKIDFNGREGYVHRDYVHLKQVVG